MLKRLAQGLRGSDGDRSPSDGIDEGDLAGSIATLTAMQEDSASRERERDLVQLRHRLGAKLVSDEYPAPEDRSREFPGVDESGVAVASASELDGALVRGGINAHGYVLVRGLIARGEALHLAERIQTAFRARQARHDQRGGMYEEFVSEPPYPDISGRSWVTAGGGLMAADSPPVLFDLIETFERVGIRRVVSEFLDQPITISVEKTTLRRADPGPPGGWHQDGSFMGETRALNVWVSLSDCGIDAPGLEFVPRRIDDLIEAGGEGSGTEHLDTPADDEFSLKNVLIAPTTAESAAGEFEVMSPRFAPGDVMLFDDRFLHRTAANPAMANSRYAIEVWFFGASGFPRDYTPLAF